MNSVKACRLLAAVGVAALAASSAQATLYGWNWTPAIGQAGSSNYGYSAAGGAINSINATFDSATKRLTFDARFGAPSGGSGLQTQGYWLVINNGPNPKNLPGQYAIFYFDGRSFSQPKLTVYGYNGQNSNSSWRDGNGAASGTPAGDLIKGTAAGELGYINSISAGDSGGQRRFFFDIDASSIINRTPAFPASDGSPWEGTGFANKLGIWFHPATAFPVTYGGTKGGITAFGTGGSEGFLDGAYFNTFIIPTPSAAALMGAGLLVASRRRRTA